MKKITLTTTEFYQFKELAEKFKIVFNCIVASGFIIVEADAQMLEYLGF